VPGDERGQLVDQAGLVGGENCEDQEIVHGWQLSVVGANGKDFGVLLVPGSR
jgi:hypothetical protein